MRVVDIIKGVAARAHVEDRARGRGVAPAGTVAVGVVGRQAQLAMLLQVDVVQREDHQALQHALGVRLVEPQRLVGVGQVGRRRSHHGQLRPRLAKRCADEERHVAFDRDSIGPRGGQAQRIEAGAPIGGDGQVEVG